MIESKGNTLATPGSPVELGQPDLPVEVALAYVALRAALGNPNPVMAAAEVQQVYGDAAIHHGMSRLAVRAVHMFVLSE
jgi:hypothetical protein